MSARSSIMYRCAENIALPFYTLFTRTVIEGEHFIPAEGPVILVSNHISYVDPLSLGYLARRRKRQVRFLAKDSLFRRAILGWFFRACQQIPVARNTAQASDSLLAAERALGQGEVIGIYPEATMPDDLQQLPLKTGAARLAAHTGVPVIVVGTWGAHRTWRKGGKPSLRFRRPHVMVVTAPYTIAGDSDIEQARNEMADRLHDATNKAKKKLGE